MANLGNCHYERASTDVSVGWSLLNGRNVGLTTACLTLIFFTQAVAFAGPQSASAPKQKKSPRQNLARKVKKPNVESAPIAQTPEEIFPISETVSALTLSGKYPPVADRVAAYQEQLSQKKVKREDGRPYLVEGLSIVGVSETEYGYSAFVKVEDGNTVIVRQGTPFYNGIVERVEPTRIVFRLTENKKLVEKRYGQAVEVKTDADPQ